MMKLTLMRTATGKKDPELPLLQSIDSVELTAPQDNNATHLQVLFVQEG